LSRNNHSKVHWLMKMFSLKESVIGCKYFLVGHYEWPYLRSVPEPNAHDAHGAVQLGPGDALEFIEDVLNLFVGVNNTHLFVALHDLPEQVHALLDERLTLLLLTVLLLSSLGGWGRRPRRGRRQSRGTRPTRLSHSSNSLLVVATRIDY
jgi:hypothetical protein